MLPSVADQFIRALEQIEQVAEFEPMLAILSDQCVLSNLTITMPAGKQNALLFWKEYLASFQEIRTEFKRVTEQGHLIFLEWTSEGRLKSEKAMSYEGVTVIETQKGQIVRLKIFYGKHSERLGLASVKPLTTAHVMEGGPNRDKSTPSEGVLTSKITDRDAATD